MKSEHRHELKTNELRRLASEWGQISEKYVHQHTVQLIVALVVVIAAIGGFVYWKAIPASADRDGWRSMVRARTSAEFAEIADKYPGTKVAAWARLCEADQELASGVRQLFTDRDAGRSELKKCRENYEKLVSDRSAPTEVLERALFGLARCREAFPPDKSLPPSQINDAAIRAYQRVIDEVPESVFKEPAEQRIAALRTGTAQSFYEWFDSQNPKPADREMPKDLIPPAPDAPIGELPSAPAVKSSPAGKAAADMKQEAATQTPSVRPKASTAPTGPAAKGTSSGPASKVPVDGRALPPPAKPAGRPSN